MQTIEAPAAGLLRLTWRIPELANALGLSERTVYRLIDENKLDALKIGAARVVTDSSVQKLLATSPRQAGSVPGASAAA